MCIDVLARHGKNAMEKQKLWINNADVATTRAREKGGRRAAKGQPRLSAEQKKKQAGG